MNILVTGGAGFIGSHLCSQLIQQGHRVTVLDNFSTSTRENLRDLLSSPQFQLLEGDVRDAAAVDDAASSSPGVHPDAIFHLAAAVGVRTILERPLDSLETNLRGTENVLKVASRWRGRVMVASTSEVYGKNDASLLTESSDRVLGAGDVARWWYAVAKMADEALALAYHRERRLQALVVRLFNTVGPRQTAQYGMVLPTLIRQALAGQPLTVFGDGDQTRCFTYVDDTVRALICLAATEEAYGQIFNVGQPRQISINRLANRILELTGARSAIVHVPYEEAYGDSYEDMRRRVPDCTRLRQTIGFAPTDRLDEAIEAVAAHMRASLDGVGA